MIKILNLYAGIGGNRKLWHGDIEVTAIEHNPDVATIYKDFFPNDKVIITDAHQYLLEHYKEYDFIWSSPPCQSHSTARYRGTFRGDTKVIYPDMKLYQEIILLKKYYKGIWVVENVKSYYEPLIKPQELDRHFFWANFRIPKIIIKREYPKDDRKKLAEMYGFPENIPLKYLRNCIDPRIGLYIFEKAMKIENRRFKIQQLSIFDYG